MAIRMPDLLTREIRHLLEGFQNRARELGLHRWVGKNPRLMIGAICLLTLLLTFAAVRALKPTPARVFQHGETTWFYDVNTGKLFVAGYKQVGPIAAPSGPTLRGELAGFRAHVYSYVLDPNEADLFVGFLERPDPAAHRRASASDMRDVDEWAQRRLIKRVKDKQWVQATSSEGQEILDELLNPNEKGQTPVYQMPR